MSQICIPSIRGMRDAGNVDGVPAARPSMPLSSSWEQSDGHGTPRRMLRIALFSHDTMGIGHVRRNLLIAQALTESGSRGNALIVAGVREAGALAMPSGIDCVTLPSLEKDRTGQYRPRGLRMPLEELVRLRSRTIEAAVDAFRPDVFIVDKAPRGACRELDPVLRRLRRQGHTRCVLGLREVLDDPVTVEREWARDANAEAVGEFYDAVWIYGDPAVYDLVREYALPKEIAAKVRYTGYFDHRARLEPGRGAPDGSLEGGLDGLALPPGPLALCMVGGGQDGERLAAAFCEAALPPKTNAVLVMGPFMPGDVRKRLRNLSAGRPRLRALDFLADTSALLSRADRVVAMGGYNTVYEALSFEKRTLVAPRVSPRREQAIRAKRLQALGLVDVLPLDEVGPDAISAWLHRDLGPAPPFRQRLDVQGLSRLPRLLTELFVSSRLAPAVSRRVERCIHVER